MENLLKRVLGDFYKVTLDILIDEEVDMGAFQRFNVEGLGMSCLFV
mgnify:CR=1 FL=1